MFTVIKEKSIKGGPGGPKLKTSKQWGFHGEVHVFEALFSEIFKILIFKIERKEMVEYAAAMTFHPHIWG